MEELKGRKLRGLDAEDRVLWWVVALTMLNLQVQLLENAFMVNTNRIVEYELFSGPS
jgi:hypothetical protein